MQYYPGRPFRLPYELQRMYAIFWPPRRAARVLHLSYRKTLQFMVRNPDLCAYVRVIHPDSRMEWIYCLNAEEWKTAEG